MDPEPNTVDYLGSVYSPTSASSLLNNSNSMYVNLATVTTDASGNFTFQTKAPTDFGGRTRHLGGRRGRWCRQWFLRPVAYRDDLHLLRGQSCTPITPVTYTSMDANAYGGGGCVLWDNHYAGEIMGNWTRGTGKYRYTRRCTVGTHLIGVGDAISFQYLNPIQS